MPELLTPVAAMLTRATSGPLAGHTAAPVNFVKFADFKARCYAAHIPYLWGGKAPHPGSGLVDFPLGIDCSGFFRALMMYACEGAMHGLPDGSYTQGDWLAAQGFKQTDPANCANSDGRVRVCIHHPDHMDEAGHIWVVVGGQRVHSVESYGGHGPGERAWNAPLRSGHTLNELASLCFVLM